MKFASSQPRLIRRRITVSVSSSSNRGNQQHRQAVSDTQDNNAHVHLPHKILHYLSSSGKQVLTPVPNMLNSSTWPSINCTRRVLRILAYKHMIGSVTAGPVSHNYQISAMHPSGKLAFDTAELAHGGSFL